LALSAFSRDEIAEMEIAKYERPVVFGTGAANPATP
jgi:hypothetical protein